MIRLSSESKLQRKIEKHAASRYNNRLLSNLAIAVGAHNEQASAAHPDSLALTQYNQEKSGNPVDGSVYVDRSPQIILSAFWRMKPKHYKAFAAGGRVVDVGCGASGFLDYFTNSETVAIDAREEYVGMQRAKSHDAHVAGAHDLSVIGSQTVRVLNASNSVPLWARNPTESSQAAEEYIRVLEPGGIALITPLTHRRTRRRWEEYVAAQDSERQTASILGLHEVRGVISHTTAAFSRVLLENLEAGVIRVASFRPADLLSERPTQYRNYIPGQVIIQKN